MVEQKIHIIMPVKDSIERAEEAIRAVLISGQTLTVYDDNSTPENATTLDHLAQSLQFELVHLKDLTSRPSPNYRLVLQHSQQKALQMGAHLVIVESDVVVRPDTIRRLTEQVNEGIGMVAAITVDERGKVNFPYRYAHLWRKHTHITHKRFSFCCTLLTNDFLHAFSFGELDPTKNWYDVFISHQSVNHGFTNLLMCDNPVLHRPHSSRPWKQLKYTNPLLYYWRKITKGYDKI